MNLQPTAPHPFPAASAGFPLLALC